MRQLGVNFYVFYHDADTVRAVSGEIEDPRFATVNLNAVPLPTELRVPSLAEDENRAIFSEYLGHYTLTPRGTVVGTFTYSIPLKFSKEWAAITKVPMFNEPPLSFEGLLDQAFEHDKCYAVELADPFRTFPHFMHELHDTFRVGPGSLPENGPYKGSVVVERQAYEQFQCWFREVVQHFLKKFPWGEHEELSGFSTSQYSNKSSDELKLGRYRSGLGVLLEHCVAYYFGQVYRDRLVRIGDVMSRNNPDSDLASIVNLVKKSNTVVIAFANANYDKVLRNWIASVRRVGVNNVLVVALDPEIEQICTNLQIPYYRLEVPPDSFPDLMRARVRMFRDLSAIGVDFINSDLDAIWLRDPREYLSGLQGDLLVSTGTIHPLDFHEEWGFTLCAGFFMSRASEKMRLFYELMLQDDRSDQISMANVLSEDNVDFEVTEAYQKTFRNKIVQFSEIPISGQGDNFDVKVLPHHLFQRLVDDSNDAFVKHPQAPKNQTEKLDCLRELGCYLLD